MIATARVTRYAPAARRRARRPGAPVRLPRFARARYLLGLAYAAAVEGDDWLWETRAAEAFTLLTGDPNALAGRMGEATAF